VLLLFLCYYLLKDLVLPPCIPSCKSWESLRINNLHFFLVSSFFTFLFLNILFYFIFILMFFLPLF
jgi:hypothetical protein